MDSFRPPAPAPVAFSRRRGESAEIARLRLEKQAASDPRANARTIARNRLDELDAQVRRETDPVEQARLFLQRRGNVIYRASVDGGPHHRWVVDHKGCQLDDEELIRLAEHRGLRKLAA